MNTVIYAKRFLEATAALAPRDRKLIDNAVMEFARGSKSKGLRLHKLNCKESRFHSISANDDLRIIVLIDGDTRVVMHADHHDAAYRWAERHEVRMHEITQVPQIIEFVESVEQRVHFTHEQPEIQALFEIVDDELLANLGVPAAYVRLVRKVRNDDDLGKLGNVLPEEAWEALVEIAAGAEPELVLAEFRELNSDAINADSFTGSAIIGGYSTQTARRRFWIADSEQALGLALAMPWAAWRVYLHPSQAAAVKANHNGPARITGGAGTGKSVVLVHRAVRLAKESPSTRVLLSTFSKLLSLELSKSVDELLGDDRLVRNRIDVANLHEHANQFLQSVEPGSSLASSASQRDMLKEAVSSVGYLAHPMSFIFDEWNHIVDYWGVGTLESYLSVSRKGRGRALSRVQRELLWPVFKHTLDTLENNAALTRASMCQCASDLQSSINAYDHVLLDEAQDFGPREIRYAYSLVNGTTNGLYLGADDGQRIYSNPYPLTSVGINIRGRSRRLRVNYRTSAQIHDFSVKVLPAEQTDDDISKSRRVTSLFGSIEPEVKPCESRFDEAQFIASWIKGCQESGIRTSEIALLGRHFSRLQDIRSFLEKTISVNVTRLNDRKEGHLALDTLHAAKGLEFKAVAIIGVEDGTLPFVDGLDGTPGDDAHALALARERHLLYVGCTRARELLVVTYVGNRSRFLPKTTTLKKL